MSWTEESLLAAFPRDNMQYFIQFIEEPKVIEKSGKYGSWTELSISLQFFAIDDVGLAENFSRPHLENFHYTGSKALAVKPCALEDLSCFGPDIVTRLIHVKGRQHGKHVDLELMNSWDRISASANQRDAQSPAADRAMAEHSTHDRAGVLPVSSGAPQEQEGPSKPAAAAEDRLTGLPAQLEGSSERGQPQAGGDIPLQQHAAGSNTNGGIKTSDEPPAACSHDNVRHCTPVVDGLEVPALVGFYCKDCGERVG